MKTIQIYSILKIIEQQLLLKYQLISIYDYIYNSIQQQIINEHNGQVIGLSINQDSKKLVLVLEINKFYEQKDLMDNCGILNKIFLKIVILFHLQQQIYLHFNPVVVNIYNSIQLIIPLDYMQNQRNSKFKELDKIVSSIFAKYIYPPDNLLSKNEYCVNLIQFNFDYQNWDCEFIEDIEFDQRGNFGNIFGTMVDNGEYFLTWDSTSGNIEIRQFTYKNEMNDHLIINQIFMQLLFQSSLELSININLQQQHYVFQNQSSKQENKLNIYVTFLLQILMY
ncbi:unnamed protein product [Paramecium pentaurelia]|uniref:Uncharacterized protein n=1 Tax=Paramecium pentaurelia TaxID=43138 RepID=A0A8S1T7L7_9CILI|nr:unnamed protein product [Paramecium pentaurelia]